MEREREMMETEIEIVGDREMMETERERMHSGRGGQNIEDSWAC